MLARGHRRPVAGIIGGGIIEDQPLDRALDRDGWVLWTQPDWDENETWIAETRAGVTVLWAEVGVPVKSLCPCSKEISDYGAHNQRGIVTYSVRCKEPVWIEDLIELVERSASCELYSLLKRPDEKAVTERAYDNPVFVEDLVRNVALKLKAHREITWWKVEAENYESIHNHNAYACIEKPTGRG